MLVVGGAAATLLWQLNHVVGVPDDQHDLHVLLVQPVPLHGPVLLEGCGL